MRKDNLKYIIAILILILLGPVLGFFMLRTIVDNYAETADMSNLQTDEAGQMPEEDAPLASQNNEPIVLLQREQDEEEPEAEEDAFEYDRDYDFEYEYEYDYEALNSPPFFSIIDIAKSHEELAEGLDAIAIDYNCAAVSLVFFNDEAVFYTYQFGYADIGEGRLIDADTKMRVASLSKLVVVMTAMTLVDEGVLDLNEDISVYLGYEVRNPSFPNTPITSMMLMRHTSSIVDSDEFHSSRAGNSSRSTQHLLGLRSSYRGSAPGTRFEYGNFPISVLAAVCEQISGRSLDTLSRERIFEPLGIDAGFLPANIYDTGNIAAIYNSRHNRTRSVESQTAIEESDEMGHDHHLAQGNLTISALDFARVLAMLVNGGALGDARILSEEAVSMIHTVDPVSAHFSHGLSVRFHENAFLGESAFWHTGSAFGTFAQFIYCLDARQGVVVITTGAYTGRVANDMVRVCLEMSELVWEYLG